MVMKVVSIVAKNNGGVVELSGQLGDWEIVRMPSSTAEVRCVSNLIIRSGTSGGGVKDNQR